MMRVVSPIAVHLVAAAVLLALRVVSIEAEGHHEQHHKKIVIHVPDNVHYHHHQHFTKVIVPEKHHHEHLELSHDHDHHHHHHDHELAASSSSETGTPDLSWTSAKGLGDSWASSLKSLGHSPYSFGGHGLSGHAGYTFGGHKFAGYTGGSATGSEDTAQSASNAVESSAASGSGGISVETPISTTTLSGGVDSLGSFSAPASFKHSGVSVLTLAGQATPVRANPFAWLQSHGWHTAPGTTLRTASAMGSPSHMYAVRTAKAWRSPRMAYTLVAAPSRRWRAVLPAVMATVTPAANAAAAAAAAAMATKVSPMYKSIPVVKMVPAYKPVAVPVSATVTVPTTAAAGTVSVRAVKV